MADEIFYVFSCIFPVLLSSQNIDVWGGFVWVNGYDKEHVALILPEGENMGSVKHLFRQLIGDLNN